MFKYNIISYKISDSSRIVFHIFAANTLIVHFFMDRTTLAPSKMEKARFGFFLLIITTVITSVDFIFNIFGSNINSDMNLVSWLYYIPASLGHAALFAVVLYLIFYLPFSLIFGNYKIATCIYLFTAVLLQMFIVLDGMVFNIYRFHFNGFVLELILGGGTEVFDFDFWVIVKFTGIAILISVVPYTIAYFIGKKTYHLLRKKTVICLSAALIICVLISHIGHAVAAAIRQSPILKSATAMPFFFPLTANTLLMKMGIAEPDDLDQIYNIPSSDIQYPIYPLKISDSIPKLNIIYIVIDSWNPRTYDSINCPNISKFAQKAQYFSKHLSSNNGTRGSIIGLFFGMSATYEKEITISKLSPLLIDRLIDLDYNIQVFPSAILTSPPIHELVFRRTPDINLKSEGKTPFDRDQYITDSFCEYVDKQVAGRPFFSFLFYDTPHATAIPKEHNKKFGPAWDEADYTKLSNDIDPLPYFNLYKNCVYYTDSLIGKVTRKLEEKGMLENSVIVITGDHGQEFNENRKNYWGHGSNFSDWQIQVPFILYYPGIEANKVFGHTTTHYDVAPTIMSLFLGVQNPSLHYSMGYEIYDIASRYPHIVGDNVNYGFVFENAILRTNHLGNVETTDRKLNEISSKKVSVDDLKEAVSFKNHFYKR